MLFAFNMLTTVCAICKSFDHNPTNWPVFASTVNVTSMAPKVAVRAAIDPACPLGIVDVYGIIQHRQQKSA